LPPVASASENGGSVGDLAGSFGLLLLTGGLGLLAYTYIGYPLLTAILPKRPAARSGGRAPRPVSVIVAARSGGASVAAKAAWLLGHTDEKTEIVVVLDGADSAAEAALAALVTTRLSVAVLPGRPGKCAALNRGVALARGEILVFADVRPRIAPDAITRLVAAVDSPDVGAAAAAFDTEPSERPNLLEVYWRLERWIRRNEAAFDSCIGTSGCLYAVERACWHTLPEGLLLDDVWVPMNVIRAGKRVAYVPDALVVDVPYGSDGTELVRKVRTLTGNYQLLLWMPWLLNPGQNRVWLQFVSHKLLRLLTPAFTGAAAIGAGLLAVASPAVAWLAAGMLALLAGLGITLWRRRPLWQFGRTAFVMHVALVTALANALRRRWDVWDDPPRPRFSEVPSR
jgi:cellulose synthase/poly-beta-1,6-N-acetylglucosamine synthase-like glycosyltransferase